MTKVEKESYSDKQAVGVKVITNTCVIEVLDIQYGIEDYVVIRGYTGDIHKLKIYCTEDSYFNYGGQRQHLSEFMRV